MDDPTTRMIGDLRGKGSEVWKGGGHGERYSEFIEGSARSVRDLACEILKLQLQLFLSSMTLLSIGFVSLFICQSPLRFSRLCTSMFHRDCR